MKLQGKNVVVTGASSGMGHAIVELFAKEGANIIAVARRKERLEQLAESLKSEPGKVVPFAGDVSQRDVCEAMLEEAVKQFGRLDILVNNAGIMDDMAAVANFSDEKYEKVMAVNVYGPLAAARKAVQIFLEQGDGGNIITVSSIGAQHQAAGVVYGASKAAVNAMVRHIAYTYQKEKIRSNAIAPGAISTEIGTAMGMPNMDGYMRIKPVQDLMPGAGEAIDIANTALFLAADDSAFINGQILAVDGGWTSF